MEEIFWFFVENAYGKMRQNWNANDLRYGLDRTRIKGMNSIKNWNNPNGNEISTFVHITCMYVHIKQWVKIQY